MTSRRWILAAPFALAFAPAPARADRPPTPEERVRIEAVLRENGFVSWDEIELDDGLWEVDDARTAGGENFDLKLDPNTLAIVRRERD